MPEVTPIPKAGPRKKKPRVGRAEPERPMAQRCEAAIRLVCSGRATHRHHILPRSAGGGHGRENSLDTCASCHDFIHAHPEQAYAWGFLRRRP